MVSNIMATTVPASLPPLSPDGVRLAAIGRLLRSLKVPTASTNPTMKWIQSAIELEPVELPSKMPVTNVLPPVVADTVSTSMIAPSIADFNLDPLSGNNSDTEKHLKEPESEDSDDEFWLKEYAKRHRKKAGSPGALQLEKRLQVLRQVNAQRRNSATAVEASTEEILQSLYQALVAEKSKEEALSSPTPRSEERSGPSEIGRDTLLPHQTHSAPHPPAGIDAVSPEFTKELDSKVEKQVQSGQKWTLADPASAKTRRNNKKTGAEKGKPRARKRSAPRLEKRAKTVRIKEPVKSKVIVTKVGKVPYTTRLGRQVKKTRKMEEVAQHYLESF